jgi:carboxyl-terminal processing protease
MNNFRVFSCSIVAVAAFAGLSFALPAVEAHTVSPQANTGTQNELNLLTRVIEQVHANYVDKPDDAKMIEGAINGMLAALDPHSSYMNAKQYADMQKDLSGEFGGVGLEVTADSGAVRVLSPIDGTPAAHAGLRAGDIITSIDGEPVGTTGLANSVDRMRGPLGSKVTLTITRTGTDKPFEVTLTRALVHVNPVKARVEGDVAYLSISSFSGRTSTALQTAIKDLKNKIGPQLKGYVLDLRNDPGGLLDEAISVSGQFITSGRIVTVKGRGDQDVEHADVTAGDITDGKPIVALINGGTASAAEIVAGALQDDKRATIVGTRSFGKGTVQTIIPIGKSNGALRLTTARYFTPSGRSIQAKGIEPDIVVNEAIPADLKGKTVASEAMGEGSLSNHLKNPDGGDENAHASPTYVSDKPETDTQLQYALGLLRGNSQLASGAASKPVAGSKRGGGPIVD